MAIRKFGIDAPYVNRNANWSSGLTLWAALSKLSTGQGSGQRVIGYQMTCY